MTGNASQSDLQQIVGSLLNEDSRSPVSPEAHSEDTDTRSRLLAAAGPVFASSGFDGATVREICAVAGVNIASVGYYFGDKMGLYRHVIRGIRDAREAQFPNPDQSLENPKEILAGIVHTMLSRILADGPTGWESQLFMREMQNPTPVFGDIVREFFRPIFNRLIKALAALIQDDLPDHVLEMMALGIVGQCVYYRVGGGVISILIPEERRRRNFDIDSISDHIVRATLASIAGMNLRTDSS